MRTKILMAFLGIGLFTYSCGESQPEVTEELKEETIAIEAENEELGNDIMDLQQKQAELDEAIEELDEIIEE